MSEFRKWAFAVFGVYGEIPDLEFEGVWLWRGTEVPQQIKEHDSYDYSEYRKLDINKPEERQLIQDFWLKT